MEVQNQVDDKVLIRQYIKGDEKSFEILLNRYKDRVYSYVFMIVKDHELADDIFQDTFMKVIKTLKKGAYNEEGKFLPWVMRIAHNLSIDHFRRLKKMPMINENSGKEEFNIFSVLKMTEPNVEEVMIKEQIESDVVRLVDHLPEEQKKVLKMRIFQEMSFKDIALKEDISINTALGRMRYALINMRKLIEKHNISITL